MGANEAVNIYDEAEEGNIKLEPIPETGAIEVSAGTLNQLVKYLTSEKMLGTSSKLGVVV